MELYKEILVHILRKGEVRITFQDFDGDLSDAIESECYKALSEIRRSSLIRVLMIRSAFGK